MKLATQRLIHKAIAVTTLFCMATQPTLGALLNLAQVPLFVGANVPPQVMLTISKDRQLYRKAYNDYSDLDGDGQIDTTYKHSINYYGYFDPFKCYSYSSNRFEPDSVTNDKYCSGKWSGNFLNWVTMSRMDAVRKMLYGGLRSTDTSSETVLERAYLPTDAHAWAKHYNGPDIAKLTPFSSVPTAPTTHTGQGSANFSIPNVPLNQTQDVEIDFSSSQAGNLSLGDQVRVERHSGPTGENFFIGAVLAFPGGNRVRFRIANPEPAGTGLATTGLGINNWRITNLSRVGVSFCNVTTGATSGNNMRSSTNANPPLMRAALGNFELWNANERWQCQWFEERNNTQGGFGGIRSNGNIASLSEIQASAENPRQGYHGSALGSGTNTGEWIVRVKVCDPSKGLGTERCKQYPNGNWKPIGLLQEYGDPNLIHFGLMTGSHRKNISGGVLRKNITSFNNEVRVTTDGRFYQPGTPPNSPRAATSTQTPPGIVNTLNYMRVYGYRYDNGTYQAGTGDNCTYQLTNIVENDCTSWGNPMSEIYFESLRYLAGRSPTSDYTFNNNNSKDNELGLPVASWNDPLNSENYCAPLNVLVFNASVSTNDDDLRTVTASDINSSSTVAQLTNVVGQVEGINGNDFFVGKLIGPSATPGNDPGYELCSPKTISGLGDVSGICPEGPTLAGSYLIAGLAHHARTHRIRTDIPGIPESDERSLKVTTYGIQLATNTPQLVIPVPGSVGKQVVIQPIYRLVLDPGVATCPAGGPPCLGGGALVDMKFVRQEVVGNIARGMVYINWEDSEQGGDYDQDMWGILEWELDAGAGTVTVTTNAVSASTANPQGFGYTISGTHFHSGILGFNYADATGVLGCTNCQVSSAAAGQRGRTSVTYNLGATAAGTLKDPLWYAAKFGGFVDSNESGVPDVQSEWDSRLEDGTPGQDGIPDNYFLVTNPLGLESALERAFIAILSNATAASVATNSTSLQTGTTIYQARFNANDWSGQVLAFPVNPDGTVSSNPSWDAGQVINSQDFNAGRVILTYDTTPSVRDGTPFRWAQIPTALQTHLDTSPSTNANDGRGQQRLNYLRGDPSQEGATATAFRQRPTSKLGDIVNSNPNFVAAPNAGIGEASYNDFRLKHLDRPAMIYVGGNDGMLHGFRASDGRELLAYVPSKTHPHLNQLTNKGYVHRYYVDGSPEVGDAFVNGEWRTVLVGGLGAGGQGLFALDVTDPSQFTEANAQQIVMWEFNDTDNADLGYVMGQPLIRKMANGRWAAIVSAGYNNSEADGNASANGRAWIFVLFLDGPTGPNRTWIEGTDYVKLDGRIGSVATPNGFSPPFAADVNANGVVDYIYAGTLTGGLHKYDVTDANAANWGHINNHRVLFVAQDGLGNPQPITAPVEATLHPSGQGFLITFGTGKYLETTDPHGPYTTQSFYGIWDKNDAKPISGQTWLNVGRTQLLEQTITNVTVGNDTFRVVSDNMPDWSTDTTPPGADDSPPRHMGWYMDFPNATVTGERSVFRPILTSGRLIFTTLVPSTQTCLFGGTSFLMVVNPSTGGRIEGAVLDVDANGLLNSEDQIQFGGDMVYASGVQSTIGITPTPTIIKASGGTAAGGGGSLIFGTEGPLVAGAGFLMAYALAAGSSGGNASTMIGLSASAGRVSWRELQSD
jgi:type IV pilus assembly protein PilY1